MLRPKSLELLLFLLRNRGRVVGRAEILDTVWPRVVVSDDSVTRCIVDIRKALGPSGLDLLRTVPRRGYLLEAGPEAAATTRLQAEGRPSVAVLPFRKDYADPDEASLADGIIGGIVHVLSGLEQIFVMPRSSSLAVAKTTVEARAVGRELGVGYVLYGGVRRSGDRLRIATELSETRGRRHHPFRPL